MTITGLVVTGDTVTAQISMVSKNPAISKALEATIVGGRVQSRISKEADTAIPAPKIKRLISWGPMYAEVIISMPAISENVRRATYIKMLNSPVYQGTKGMQEDGPQSTESIGGETGAMIGGVIGEAAGTIGGAFADNAIGTTIVGTTIRDAVGEIGERLGEFTGRAVGRLAGKVVNKLTHRTVKAAEQGMLIRCFKEDTIVEMSDGSLIQVSDLAVGDEVKDRDGFTKVTNVTILDGSFAAHEFHFSNNSTLTATSPHFMIVQREEDTKVVPASFVRTGDLMMSDDGYLLTVTAVRDLNLDQKVNVEVESALIYVNGILATGVCELGPEQECDLKEFTSEHRREHAKMNALILATS